MSTQIMTVKQYADIRRVSKPAVTKALNRGKKLIGVQFAQKIGRDWILTVCNPVTKKDFGKCVVIQR